MTIAGKLDLYALQRLAHRPTERAPLQREARKLAAMGLSASDIASCLQITRPAAAALLTDEPNGGSTRDA